MYRVKIGEKGVIYLPIDIRRKLGVEEGGELTIIVGKGYIILKPVKTIFKLGAEVEKVSEVSVEEFERESEEYQRRFYE